MRLKVSSFTGKPLVLTNRKLKMATEIVTPLAPEAHQEDFLPFSAPWFGDEEKNEVLQTLDSDWITTGPRTKALEAKFAEYIGSGEAVAVRSVTAALHLALAATEGGPVDGATSRPRCVGGPAR